MPNPALTELPAECRHLLPDLALELADAIGLDAALKIAQLWGGRRLYVPAKLAPGHHLIRLLGRDAAERLCAMPRHSESIPVPRCAAALRALLNAQIIRAYNAGASAATLAAEHGCTERWIYYVIAQARDSNQSSPQQALL